MRVGNLVQKIDKEIKTVASIMKKDVERVKPYIPIVGGSALGAGLYSLAYGLAQVFYQHL